MGHTVARHEDDQPVEVEGSEEVEPRVEPRWHPYVVDVRDDEGGLEESDENLCGCSGADAGTGVVKTHSAWREGQTRRGGEAARRRVGVMSGGH